MPPRPLALLALAAALAACGDDAPPPAPTESSGTGASTPSTPGTPPASTTAEGKTSPWALSRKPEGGVEVIAAKGAAPKESVVVVGRVREKLLRRAGFSMIDESIPYCGETEMEGCPTPWDYCCIPPERVAAATISVRVKGKDGRTVAVDRIPELRNLDLVAVTGDLVKDEEDVVLEAKGWYLVERPTIGQEVDWPE
jgi:hypothetical protein